MRKNIPVIFVLAISFCLTVLANDTWESEYENVDVVMELAWSDAVTTEAVDIIVITHNEEPVQVVLLRKKKKLTEITLMDGVVVKVYNHENGELLATFSKSSKEFPS
jgi:hypothetical protein